MYQNLITNSNGIKLLVHSFSTILFDQYDIITSLSLHHPMFFPLHFYIPCKITFDYFSLLKEIKSKSIMPIQHPILSWYLKLIILIFYCHAIKVLQIFFFMRHQIRMALDKFYCYLKAFCCTKFNSSFLLAFLS